MAVAAYKSYGIDYTHATTFSNNGVSQCTQLLYYHNTSRKNPVFNTDLVTDYVAPFINV